MTARLDTLTHSNTSKEKPVTSTNAVNRWRERNKAVFLGRSAARAAALRRLADQYPRVYRRLYEEECEARGVKATDPRGRPGKGERRAS